MVYCERTVRAGGGLVKDTGMLIVRDWVTVFHNLHGTGPRRVSGRAQDTTRGGAGYGVLQRTVENLACVCE